MTGGIRNTVCILLAVVLISSCQGSPGRSVSADPELRGYDSPLRYPLSLEAAREAHRRAELRRHLRFLEAIDPGHLLRATAPLVRQVEIDSGKVPLGTLYETGRLLFEHEYSFADGLGARGASQAAAGGQSPFRRVHQGRFGGPETTTCTSCHWRGGPAGAGALQDNSFLYGDGDALESADPRNPPPLQGVGVVEVLAQEMSAELQSLRASLQLEARRQGREVVGELTSKGVTFGVLRVAADGTVDTTGVEGVDPDLVIRPFGWKGTFATLRDFVKESLQVHLGIQSEDLVQDHKRHPDPELVGSGTDPDDPDGDGVRDELTAGQLTALISFLAMQEMPVVRPPETLHDFAPVAKNVLAPTATVFLDDWTRGKQLFDELECSTCHVPRMVLKDPVFRTRSATTGEVLQIDLSRVGERPRLQYDPRLKGYPVWLFSDLKRHDLGESSASRHVDHGVPRQVYQTRRLWGLASSPPYFYDGHAPWFDQAISAHGAEAEMSATAYSALTYEDKGALRVYLLSLRRERRLIVP